MLFTDVRLFRHYVMTMNWKTIFLTGALTGTFVGSLMMVITHIPLGHDSDGHKITVMYHWQSALLVVIGIPLVSAFGVNKISKMSGRCEPSLKHLIPVAYLTFLIPVLGASFGAPNSNLVTLATIVMLGAIGGIFWSTPFALWSYYKSRGNQSISGGDLGGNVPDTDQSDE
jgi:hypothetical protein